MGLLMIVDVSNDEYNNTLAVTKRDQTADALALVRLQSLSKACCKL
jgi:hypothetical protein